jgi:hypothetical protein
MDHASGSIANILIIADGKIGYGSYLISNKQLQTEAYIGTNGSNQYPAYASSFT